MMDFLFQYGLFALKTITFAIAFIVVFASAFAIKKKPKTTLEITALNKDYEDLKQRMSLEVKGKKIKKIKLSKDEKQKNKQKPCLYVIDFNGDIKASQVEQLRDSITAVLAIAEEKDEVMIRLESPGGAVNGYGLAASQLQRIRDKGISLTVCIDKVAASGGYLMSCVANKIVAAPFAIIGSIGVVAQLPNFHRFLKKNNIDVELITAGEYKRTLTFLGENTDKGRKKFQEDIEKIHHAFREYVLSHREQLDIDKVSTGEHWLAMDAYDLKLVDYLKTSDDYLIDKMSNYQAFKINKPSKPSLSDKLFKPAVKLFQTWG